ncbi:transpeptidase family protein [Flavobacteriaceae bacterium]|nr:transpeptidase family protein [Flavobacteriaceae bacterium]MDA9572236.1 transpeptidase family protein [Flavobacteriaceae bacterium]
MNDTNSLTGFHKSRFYLLISCLVIFGFVLMGKLIHLQFYSNTEGLGIAPEALVKNVVLEPSRGDIYAADGNILATSVARYSLYWDAVTPSSSLFRENKRALADSIAALTGSQPTVVLRQLENARKKKSRYWPVANDVSYSAYKRYKSFPIFNKSTYRGGLIMEQEIKREHPLGKVAERTIGYEKLDKDGTYFRVGLEGAFSQYLRGDSGLRLKQKIANGQWKPISDSNEKEPTEGFDLRTTLEVNIQDIAHSALLGQLEKFEADHGTVVVMEVNTGAIKAIANLGRTEDGKYFEKLNYAVGEAHEPGSTFKLMGMIAALEDKVIDENTLIETGKGELTFYGKYKVKDSKRGGYGTITAAKAFEVSSNVGLVKIVHDNYKNNPKQFVDRLYNMGLNKNLGLPIRGEGDPKIPYPTDEDWDGLDLPWMAYGYGVSLTPLQTLTFYNAIANNGEMVQPRFLTEIGNLGNVPHKVFAKQVLNPSICSEATLGKVQKMMFNVVDKKWGTGYRIKDSLLTMAGKTGTCQVDYTTNNVQYISSFVGYFPAVKPQYSCIVVIHRPNKTKGYYGATVAAPVFKTIAKKIFNDIPQQIHLEASKLTDLIEETQLRKEFKIPNLAGLSSQEAVEKLKALGLKVELKGTGSVKAQKPQAGTKIKSVQKVILELS